MFFRYSWLAFSRLNAGSHTGTVGAVFSFERVQRSLLFFFFINSIPKPHRDCDLVKDTSSRRRCTTCFAGVIYGVVNDNVSNSSRISLEPFQFRYRLLQMRFGLNATVYKVKTEVLSISYSLYDTVNPSTGFGNRKTSKFQPDTTEKINEHKDVYHLTTKKTYWRHMHIYMHMHIHTYI